MKTTYNYFDAVCEDIKDYIHYNAEEIGEITEDTREEVSEKLNDLLWCNDSVTGNGSGSYTFSTWQAEENLCHNLEILREACEEFGGNLGEWLERGAEHCDVSIRCYLLAGCIENVLDQILA